MEAVRQLNAPSGQVPPFWTHPAHPYGQQHGLNLPMAAYMNQNTEAVSPPPHHVNDMKNEYMKADYLQMKQEYPPHSLHSQQRKSKIPSNP